MASGRKGSSRGDTTVRIETLNVGTGGRVFDGPGPGSGTHVADTVDRRAIKEQDLARLLSRLERLVKTGGDTSALRKKILEVKRERLSPWTPLEAGDALGAGRYVLERNLGHGGVGTVWLATDTRDERQVAVKVLHGHYAQDATMVDRFARGARQMAKLDRAGAVEVLQQVATEDGWIYYVMEYVEGGDLHRALLEKELTPLMGLQALCRVAEALHEAHEKELVHRDVSPQNILLSSRGPLIGDFDLVRASDTTAGTRTGALGKMLYAAPEVLDRPQDADRRADIYGLGMTALCCAAAGNIPAIAAYTAPAFMRSLGLGRCLLGAIEKAINRDPADRYDNIRAFGAALSDALTKEGTTREIEFRPRVLLVDDDEAALGLAAALAEAPYDCMTARSAAEALKLLERHDIQVVVTDEWMPGMRGVELLTEIARKYPYVVRILLTGDPQLDAAVRAINEGKVYRFLTKPCSSTTLDMVICEALIPQTMGATKAALMASLAGHTQYESSVGYITSEMLDTLSRREREVLETLLGEGNVTGVAQTLYVSASTVRKHLQAIFRKLGVHSQIELVTKLHR